MTPWTGTDDWISWRGMEWVLGLSASFAPIGKVYIWWLARAAITGRHYKDFRG